MFESIFSKRTTMNKTDRATFRQPISLVSLVLLITLFVACSSPVVEVLPTAVPPTAIPPTALPKPTSIPATIINNNHEMVLVPAGEFTIGSDSGLSNEKPVHQLNLDVYYIDKFEVTNTQYKVCVDAGVCEQPTDTTNYSNLEYTQHPVVWVDWHMSQAYCQWRGARLPTEAEWEKAARGTDGHTYPTGDTIDPTLANYAPNAPDNTRDPSGDTTPVGSYPGGVSPYGAYDMAGNVIEWTSSLDKPYPYDATDEREDLNTFGLRVMRGGLWDYNAFELRTSFRPSHYPTANGDHLGFRCAISPLQEEHVEDKHMEEEMDHGHIEAPDEFASLSNPFADNMDAIATGGIIYRSDCVPCHGSKGAGDGYAATDMDPKPANLADYKIMSALTDGYLFWRVSKGGSMEPFNSAMPAWEEHGLTEEQRWQVISYLRTLNEQ